MQVEVGGAHPRDAGAPSAGEVPALGAVSGESARAAPLERPGLRVLALRLVVVAALVAFDLWSKQAVFAWLEGSAADELVNNCCNRGHERLMVLGDGVGWFAFMLSRNPGAAFGGFADWPHLLVAGRVIAALFLIWLVARTPARRRWFSVALVLVLSGALGNLFDNLFLDGPAGDPYGHVRDFIDVYFGFIGEGKHFPTFNFADSCITVGAILLLLSGLGRDADERADAGGDALDADAPVASA